MALTLTEELELTRGDIAPPSESLITLTHASGNNYARDFAPNAKVFDPVSDTSTQTQIDANAYLNKMLGAMQKMITSDSKGNQSLWLVMISQIAGAATSKAQLVGFDQTEWESFINDHIEMAMWLFASIKKQEVIAYNAQ